ncbi:MAG: hypothetical protein IPK80_00350, partial [Nannocystis sp.]|nr:hypothetical protein [Nannocystis sp.]
LREIMLPAKGKEEKTTPAPIVAMVRETGGGISLHRPEEVNTYEPSAVANTCHGSARSFPRPGLRFWPLGLKVALGLGSDFNGFIQQTRPASALTPAPPPPSPRRRSARRETSAAKDCHLSL